MTPNAWLELIGEVADDSREPVKTGLVRMFDAVATPSVTPNAKKVEA
jgi:hypothetical protein